MTAGELQARLTEQCRHQDRLDRARMTWWIPWIFVAGFAVSAFGLYASLVSYRAGGRVGLDDVAFALFFVMFGLAVGAWLSWPLMVKPRIVPYLAREVEPYGGPTSVSFQRGRGIFLAMAPLEELAGRLGVTPLSAFGFADDYYEQPVVWHPASAGLRTVEALRGGLPADLRSIGRLVGDLDALASVLRIALERDAGFSLVIRLYGRESIQAVMTMQARQGSFW